MRLVGIAFDLSNTRRCLDLCRYILFRVRQNPMKILPIEIVFHILDMLDPSSQESFCLAVSGGGGLLDERLGLLLFYREVIQLCIESGNKVLREQSPSIIFPCHIHADWTPYSSDPIPPEPVAKVFWSFFRDKPIMSVDRKVVMRTAEKAVKERRYQVRISAYMHHVDLDKETEELFYTYNPTPCDMRSTNCSLFTLRKKPWHD